MLTLIFDQSRHSAMKLYKSPANLFAVLLLVCSGCVNLKKVNDYSASSLENLRQFETIGYTFQQACLDACQQERIHTLALQTSRCDCSREQIADSVTLLIYQACKNYFDGLAGLSGNTLTNYKVNTLAKTINEGHLISNTPAKKEITDAYAELSNILLRMVTDGYRKKKLKEVIARANEPVKILLHYLSFNLYADLTGKLNVQEEKWKNGIYPELMQEARSDLEKKMIIDDYNRNISLIESRKNQLASFAKGLTQIANGHDELYRHRNDLTAAALQIQLTQYISDIENAISEFNKIKNANN